MTKTSAITPKPRIAWIDLLETIAIFSVVLCHCTAHIANMPLNEANAGFYLHYALRSITAVCVPLFFFANGYLLLTRPFDLKRHFRKIIKFIFIAVFWYALTLAFLVFLHCDQLAANGLSNTITSLKYGVTHLWYLGALVCLYIFFPLLKVAYDHHRQSFIYFTLICAIITFGNTLLNNFMTFYSSFIDHQGIIYTDTNFLNIFNPFRGMYGYTFVYFCLGGVVAYYFDKIKAIARQKRNLIALCGLILGWLGLFGLGLMYSKASGQIWDNIWYGYDTIFALITTISIFFLSLNWRQDNIIFRTISRNTLGIYLIHMLIIYALTTWANGFIMYYTSPLSSVQFIVSFIGVIIYTIIVLFISLGITAIIKKLPLIKNIVS